MNRSFIKKIVLLLVSVSFAFSAYAKDAIYEKDSVRLVVYEYSGNMAMYQLSGDTGLYVPLFSTVNESYYSGFYLKCGNSFQKLTRSNGIGVQSTVVDDGIQVVYTVYGKASVTVSYRVLSSSAGSGADCVRVETSVQNIGDVSETFALKVVFDTYLGENTATHFTTSTKTLLNTEYSFQRIGDDKYIRSSDGRNSVQILLSGGDVTAPVSVVVANRDKLIRNVWETSVVQGSLFDSVKTVNNSGIGVTWRDVLLKSYAKSTCVFYLTMATSGKNPPDDKDVTAIVYGNMYDNMMKAQKPVDEKTVKESGSVRSEEEPAPAQLDYAYIQSLLRRINELESSGKESDSAEIKKLNEELDKIFLELESR